MSAIGRPPILSFSFAILVVALGAACGASDAPGLTADAAAADAAAEDGGADKPAAPAGLTHYTTGSVQDAVVRPDGPTLLLMGGGRDVDAAFTWWSERIAGGDLVVLRTSGADGYNDYLYDEIGGFDSIETLIVDSTVLANDPYVAWTLAHAEAVFIAGGDQSLHLSAWRDTAVSRELAAIYVRGGFLGGTSAGLAVLSEFIYSGSNGSVISSEALADPYDPRVTLEGPFVKLPPLVGVITDSHFVARDRMGRLIAFLSRLVVDGLHPAPIGLGLDEQSAMVIDARGEATFLGVGNAYWVALTGTPPLCEPGEPLRAVANAWRYSAGDTLSLASGPLGAPTVRINVNAGAIAPPSPY